MKDTATTFSLPKDVGLQPLEDRAREIEAAVRDLVSHLPANHRDAFCVGLATLERWNLALEMHQADEAVALLTELRERTEELLTAGVELFGIDRAAVDQRIAELDERKLAALRAATPHYLCP